MAHASLIRRFQKPWSQSLVYCNGSTDDLTRKIRLDRCNSLVPMSRLSFKKLRVLRASVVNTHSHPLNTQCFAALVTVQDRLEDHARYEDCGEQVRQ